MMNLILNLTAYAFCSGSLINKAFFVSLATKQFCDIRWLKAFWCVPCLIWWLAILFCGFCDLNYQGFRNLLSSFLDKDQAEGHNKLTQSTTKFSQCNSLTRTDALYVLLANVV